MIIVYNGGYTYTGLNLTFDRTKPHCDEKPIQHKAV